MISLDVTREKSTGKTGVGALFDGAPVWQHRGGPVPAIVTAAAALVVVAVAACRGAPGASAEDAGVAAVRRLDADAGPPAPVPPTPDAAVVAPSRACTEGLGSIVPCVEELIVDAPRGRLVRVWDREDPFASSVLVAVTADGAAHHDWRTPVEELLLPAEPAVHAQICAAKLGAVVRCLPGDSFALPDGRPCSAPRRRGGRVEALVETYFGTRSSGPFRPELSHFQWSRGRDCDAYGATGISDFVDHRPPPRLTWTTPPPPAPTPAPVLPPLGDQVCDAARAYLGPDLQCQAWGFPGLDTPAGSIFYVATNAGRAEVLVRRHPDGRLVAGESNVIFADLWPILLAEVRAGRFAPGSLVVLRLLASHTPARVSGPYAVREAPDGLAIAVTFEGPRVDSGWTLVPGRRLWPGRAEVIFDPHGGVTLGAAPTD
jgi:hypothetical protein